MSEASASESPCLTPCPPLESPSRRRRGEWPSAKWSRVFGQANAGRILEKVDIPKDGYVLAEIHNVPLEAVSQQNSYANMVHKNGRSILCFQDFAEEDACGCKLLQHHR